MTIEEYKIELEILNKDHTAKVSRLNRDFAISNNSYRIDDIITDHIGSIKIEKINVAVNGCSSKTPSGCVYTGVELKKDLKPNKRNTKRAVWQSNIIK